MSDAPPPETPANPPEGAAANATSEGLPLVIHTQYVKDLSFENPNAPAVLASMSEPPKIEIALDVGARRFHERLFELSLKARLQAKAGENLAFILELEYGALASVEASVEETAIEELLVVDGARMVFPFLRRVISDCTRDGGFPPVLVNPVDFKQLHERRKQQAAEATAEA